MGVGKRFQGVERRIGVGLRRANEQSGGMVSHRGPKKPLDRPQQKTVNLAVSCGTGDAANLSPQRNDGTGFDIV
jgi:hypothetical protein